MSQQLIGVLVEHGELYRLDSSLGYKLEAGRNNSSRPYAKLLIADFMLYSDCIIALKRIMEFYTNPIQVFHEDMLQSSEKDNLLTLSLPFLFKIVSHSVLLFVTVASITQSQVRKGFARV